MSRSTARRPPRYPWGNAKPRNQLRDAARSVRYHIQRCDSLCDYRQITTTTRRLLFRSLIFVTTIPYIARHGFTRTRPAGPPVPHQQLTRATEEFLGCIATFAQISAHTLSTNFDALVESHETLAQCADNVRRCGATASRKCPGNTILELFRT